ncbi:hypothetical protein [Pseudophaeobacter sp. EL27]|uniref:hypothetical protein n=1 Tax=Pseudophaeobacter sp. EL27 TaxID=2107580 RepID=UPI0020B152C1|nr:hypothetical protein [Pseudophaeobacter sp. EL27]
MRDESEAQNVPRSKLKLANENPWYVLMTLFGEQEDKDNLQDLEVWKKNRDLWNFLDRAEVNSDRDHERLVYNESSPQQGILSFRDIKEKHEQEMKFRNSGNFMYPGFPDLKRQPSLRECEFRRSVKLAEFCFRGGLNLHASVFEEHLDLSGAVFEGDLYVSGAQVKCGLSSQEVVFKGIVNFKYVHFNGLINFRSSEFEKLAEFSCVHFGSQDKRSGRTDFQNAKFSGRAEFSSSCFFHPVIFQNVAFAEKANFGATEFKKDIYFDAAVFDKSLTLSSAIFESAVSFRAALFHGVVAFNRAEFLSKEPRFAPNFSEAVFDKPANFRGAKFETLYPVFEDAILHERTKFTVDEKGETYWPARTEQPLNIAKETCSTIRHILAKQSLSEDEHFFFRKEMHFAGQIGSIWQRLPYLLFGLFSDYGHSIARPFWFLFGVWFVGVAFFSAHFVVDHSGLFESANDWTALGLSFSNLFPVFGFGRVYFGGQLNELPPFLKFVAGFQTVASLPLLFFLGLGLRQRFRLR